MILSLPIKINNLPRDVDGRLHGLSCIKAGVDCSRYSFILYEHGESLEEQLWDDDKSSIAGFILENKHNTYHYDVDLMGRKHGCECEFVSKKRSWKFTKLWSIEWSNGVATEIYVNGDLSKSNLPKEMLPKELFSKENT